MENNNELIEQTAKEGKTLNRIIQDNIAKKTDLVISSLRNDLNNVLCKYFESERIRSYDNSRYVKGVGAEVLNHLLNDAALKQKTRVYFFEKESASFVDQMKFVSQYTSEQE